MSDELKPCPFCGGEVGWRNGAIQCDRCRLSLRVGSYELTNNTWNTRAERTCLVERIIDNGPYMEDFVVELSCGHVDNGDIPEYCRECGAKVVG